LQRTSKKIQAGDDDAEIKVFLQHPIAPQRVAMVNKYGGKISFTLMSGVPVNP